MSVWQRPQDSLVRKKSDGIVSLVVVVADDGANGPSGAAGSSAIVAGGRAGFSIWTLAAAASRLRATDGAMSPAIRQASSASRTAHGRVMSGATRCHI